MATDNKETKIVKAAPKKADSHQDEQPRVTVKAAVIPQRNTKKQQTRTASAANDRPTQRPPMGKPVVNKDLENRHRPPMGKPVVSKEVAERGQVKEDAVEIKAPAAEVKQPEVKQPEVKAVETKPAEEAKAPATEKKADAPARPARQDRTQGDRPQGDRPFRGDRPQGERPQRGDRPQGDRPQRGDRPQGDRPFRGDRPQGDRPQRGDRPQGDRPFRGDRPQGDRPQRGDRPQGDRPQRDGRPQGDRPQRAERPADKPKLETKPVARKPERLAAHDKERDKFAKLENGGKKNKQKIQERSLEKQAKPKKHNKPKPAVEEVEEMEPLPEGTTVVTVPITVAGFCEQVGISTTQVIMALMKMGIMANINQNIDEDTVMILADELKISVAVGKVEEEEEEEGLELYEDKEEDLKPRPPIITVMGHVDHGKTSLLDAIRRTNVTVSEAGGITQHIGASEVNINGQKIVFLDTPGHEAFTAMRARGAHVTDIAVLVVAADDSVKPQTIESISHAKAAGVPIIVAINKCDKPTADPERVKMDLMNHGIVVEDYGGETIAVPVSAKKGEGIVTLLEMILLQAEMLELKANPNRLATGSVIEARLDKNKGPVATLLVDNGTLKSGQSIVVGTSYGRIRLMTNYKGDTIKKAGPATAVEILGLSEVPEAGDMFNAVKDDKIAKEIAENRKMKLREEILARNAATTLEQLFSQIQEGETKDLNLIIKGDVNGSVGAIVASLEKMKNENVRVKIIHTGVGTVNESDVTLAATTGSIIIGFNVRPTTAVQTMADRENIEIRLYRVIYDIINDVEAAMKGMLDPEFKEEVLGKAEVRSTFKVPGVGIIAGTYVLEGKMVRNAEIRLVRDGIVIHEGKVSSLKRFKDDAKEVNQGYECGLGIESYNDIKEGDIIECFHMVEIERK